MKWNRLGPALLSLALAVPASAWAAHDPASLKPAATPVPAQAVDKAAQRLGPPAEQPAAQPAGQPAQNAAAPAADAAAKAEHPVLTVENANLDVGKVKEGTEAVAVFKLKNTGTTDLKILSAKPG
jgi:hypothetical protein